MKKSIFRFIGGNLRPFKIGEFTQSGLYHSNKQVLGGKAAFGLWKKIKSSIFARAEFYKPGGIFDPVTIREESKIFRDYTSKQMMGNIKMRYGKDQISQRLGEAAAQKAKKFVDATHDLFHGFKEAEHLTKEQIIKKAKAGISKRQFSEALSQEYHFMNVPRYVKEAGAEMFELPERGGYGVKKFIQTFSKQRKRDALKYQKEILTQLPKPALIHRKITAKGKGITFKKIGGKIKAIRKK